MNSEFSIGEMDKTFLDFSTQTEFSLGFPCRVLGIWVSVHSVAIYKKGITKQFHDRGELLFLLSCIGKQPLLLDLQTVLLVSSLILLPLCHHTVFLNLRNFEEQLLKFIQ